jgi:hypothetical protein
MVYKARAILRYTMKGILSIICVSVIYYEYIINIKKISDDMIFVKKLKDVLMLKPMQENLRQYG